MFHVIFSMPCLYVITRFAVVIDLCNCHDNAPMERSFRSPKAEWIPTVDYMSAALAQQDIGRLLMERYNWRRPHQFNEGLAPAVAEEKLDSVSGIS